MPLDSHFSIPIYVRKIDYKTAQLVEVTDHGIMILAAAFVAIYLITGDNRLYVFLLTSYFY